MPTNSPPVSASQTSLSRTASGARRSGDDYQDIIALEFMIEWLENPLRYTRMVVEDDDEDNDYLDDIRLDRSDGMLIVRQVKFSVNPGNDADAWTWEDLLKEREGKARKNGTKPILPSLLQKWARTWTQLTTPIQGVSRKVDAAVISNRSAAPNLAASLNAQGKADFDAISPKTRKEIARQLGGEAAARAFFAGFRFELQHASHEGLDVGLLRRLCALGGDVNGWNSLKEELRLWVRYRKEPPPDGSITLSEIKRAARWYQLQSLPQEFVIPSDYVLPDEEFHNTFIAELVGLREGCLVLRANPGAGKSTYCSALYEDLQKRKIPVIRHHYFLSLSDPRASYSGEARLNHWRAAESLMHDLAWSHHEALGAKTARSAQPDELREWLTTCGEYYAAKGQNLIVILDGLDHIWRETRSIDELRLLLDMVLPTPPGVVLLMATQPVEDEKLPPILLRHAPRDKWFHLPFLHQNSIRRWLMHHKYEIWPEDLDSASKTGRGIKEVRVHQLNKLAEAFYKKTNGHPLHLRYSLKALQDKGLRVSESTIEKLPACPHEDITEYYRNLEIGLSNEGRQILHLLASSRFSWPRAGLLECLAPTPLDQPRVLNALGDVEHLLVYDEMGLRPFHRSLLVWLQDLDDHAVYAEGLRPAIIHWLATRAPQAWRWAYEWMLRADAGEVALLLNGPTRDWAIGAVAERRSSDEIATILARAGWCALEARDLPRALEIGLLADHVYNTYHYSPHAIEELIWSQLMLEEDEHLLARLHASQDECTDIELSLIAEAQWKKGNTEKATRCYRELIRRLQTNRSRSHDDHFRFAGSYEAVFRAATLFPVEENAPLGETEVEFDLRWALSNRGSRTGLESELSYRSERMIESFANFARTHGNAAALRRALKITTAVKNLDLSQPKKKAKSRKAQKFDLRMTRNERVILLRHGVWFALENELDFSDVLRADSTDPFVLLYTLAHSTLMNGNEQPSTPPEEEAPLKYEWPAAKNFTISEAQLYKARGDVGAMFYDLFFAFLANCWRNRDEENRLWLQSLNERGASIKWPLDFINHLHHVAQELAERISRQEPTPFAWFFDQIQTLRRPQYINYTGENGAHYGVSAQMAAGRIGLDLWILLRFLNLAPTPNVSFAELESAVVCDYFSLEQWMNLVSERRKGVLTREDAIQFLQRERTHLDGQITHLNERTEAWTRLANFAVTHDLREEAQILIRRAAGCLIAHHSHKDPSLFGLIESLRLLYESANPADSSESSPGDDEIRTQVRECLLQIAWPIARVTEFTDGDETNHLPVTLAETLRVVAPEWLPNYFTELHEREMFWQARAAFKEWLQGADLSDPFQAAVASTALSSSTLKIFQSRAEAGDENARQILQHTLDFCGQGASVERFARESSSSSLPSQATGPHAPDPANYPPDRIEEYFNELKTRSFYSPNAQLDAWLEYWSRDDADAAISALEELLDRHDEHSGWDSLFNVVLRYRGREAAYPYLAKAHREASGWLRFYSAREHSRSRWQTVRDVYPEKWFGFLLDTVRGERVPWEPTGWRSVNYGFSTWPHLTEYLIIQNQKETALKIVQTMVEVILSATSCVPLSEPQWVSEIRQLEADAI